LVLGSAKKSGNKEMNFTYDALPGRVIFGVGSSRTQLAAEIERMGLSRLLLIASRRDERLLGALTHSFSTRVVGSFHDVRPHVPIETAQAARAVAAEVQADGMLALGGGSAIGTAKAVALETPLPIVAVPTTYAGSEMTPIYGLTTAQRKQTGRSLAVLPRLVIYDPQLTISLPSSISGPSAINALAHCVEAFYGPGANPITALIAEEGIRALARGVPLAVAEPENLAGRSDTLYGAYLAGAALAAAGTGLHHKICHVLGGAYNLPHAELHTVILPRATAYNEPAMPEIAERIVRAMGGSDGCRNAAGAIFDLAAAIGAPTALKDIGMRVEDLDEAFPLIAEQFPKDNPRPFDEHALRTLLEGAFWGRHPGPGERSE
jgi:alcohol dehydrogenase class IV